MVCKAGGRTSALGTYFWNTGLTLSEVCGAGYDLADTGWSVYLNEVNFCVNFPRICVLFKFD